MDSILDSLDNGARKAVFEQNLAKLEATVPFDIDALRLCTRLLPRLKLNSTVNTGSSLEEQFWTRILSYIPGEEDAERLYTIADICLKNERVVAAEISTRLYNVLESLSTFLSRYRSVEPSDEEELRVLDQKSNQAIGYLQFLRCSYWLSERHNHLIGSGSVALISSFLGLDSVDDVANDTLSAFLSLLDGRGPIVIAPPQRLSEPDSWWKSGQGHCVLPIKEVIDESFWSHLHGNAAHAFANNSSKHFRTWLQWISQASSAGIALDCIYCDSYWNKLQAGLQNGFSDQRKYCLAIIRQTLLAAQRDMECHTMQFTHSERSAYIRAYDQFAVLFETVVLDRYPNQVQACLPELTTLLGSDSKISPAMTVTLLTAALNSKIQEGIRKIVGKWYMDLVLESQADVHNQLTFLLTGFLPWATEGSLFTSTLTTTRTTTLCSHGSALTAVVARFVAETINADISTSSPSPDASQPPSLAHNRRDVVLGVIRYILDVDGRIFQPATLYLLDGLIQGLQKDADAALVPYLMVAEIDDILRVSRLTGLPEISSCLQRVYCRQLCDLALPSWREVTPTGSNLLNAELERFEATNDTIHNETETSQMTEVSSLADFTKKLEDSKHRCIQDNAFAPAAQNVMKLLDDGEAETIQPQELFVVLDAFWEEAERREFYRPVAIHLPPMLFHHACIGACILQERKGERSSEPSLKELLTKAMLHLQTLSKGRPYLLALLAKSLRNAIYLNEPVLEVLPYEQFFLDFVNDPPSVKSEFLFEIIAANNLQTILPHRTYASYYGQREWHAYAAVIDMIRSFPQKHLHIAKNIQDRLLEPWSLQKAPIHIKSKWKESLQLQTLLLLSEFCIQEDEADSYLDSLMHALLLEQWPRYRFLLEWIVARIYMRFPTKASRILTDLSNLDESSPVHIASLLKLGSLVAQTQPEEFAVQLLTHLTCFSASPKVHIRHEAQFTLPSIFDMAEYKGWSRITGNPAVVALNTFIRGQGKYSAAAWTIRTLKIDAEADYNISQIFQGQYLTIESPEKERTAHEDFLALQDEDEANDIVPPHARILLGTAPTKESGGDSVSSVQEADTAAEQSPPAQAFLQTKSGFDIAALHPSRGPPSAQNQRPASVILVASLIDNPTNLGGLSRISESFGLEALYINDVKKTAHKDFKATSVTSEKHLPIHELKIKDVPQFLFGAKTKGYEIVGIEQTDRSGMLGDEEVVVDADKGKKDVGTLPKKCVLVLGSEKGGISPEVLVVLDRCVEIRTVGVTRSLNVQTAGGIAVYEWWREWNGKTS